MSGDQPGEGVTADASEFLQALSTAGAPAVAELVPPPDDDRDEEIWAALHTIQDRLDSADRERWAVNQANAANLRTTAVAYAIPLVQELGGRLALNGDEMRTELIKTALCLRTLMEAPSDDDQDDEPED